MLTSVGPTKPARAHSLSRRTRPLLATLLALLFGLGLAQPAAASHLQGGYFTANVTATGRLQGTLTFLQLRACTAGIGSQLALTASITNPSGVSVNKTVNTLSTRCGTNSSVYTGSFDYPLDTTTFPAGAPDGNYTLLWTDTARIAGIVNLAGSGSAAVRVRAQVRKKTGVATSAPFLGSDVATGIGIGELYSQNLNASDPDDVLGNGTLTYEALTGATDLGPDSNVISIPKLTANGQIEIPVGTTSGMANGAKYIYKVRVTDDQGDFAERDVLLNAVTPNKPPVISGLDTAAGYDIADGATQVINFTATDPNGANTVTLSGAGLPSWATLTQTPGNPAQATLTLAPPADANTRKYRLNFDAVDNDATQPLTGSATIEVRVQGAPETQLLTQPSALTTSTNADFTFAAADPSYTFECRIDFGAWTACTSPKSYTGLSDGPRTFQVRANDGTRVDPTPASFTWTVDTTPPTTTFVTKPAASTTSTTANFTWTSDETGNVTYECSLDGAAFTACTTPKALTGLSDGSHTLKVRATDTLGHVEVTPAEYTWTVDRTAPDTTIDSGPSGLTGSDSATFVASSSEPGSTFECSLDGGAYAACSAPLTFTGLADGAHTIDIRSIDAAGNVDPTPATRAWTVDATAPGTTIDSGPAALSATDAATFSFSSPDGTATFECKLDGGSWAACTAPAALTGLADGNHTFEVRAKDAAGNVDPTPATYTWAVDTGAPATTIDVKPAALSASADATFSFSSPDNSATFECKLDAGTWVPCPSPKALTGLTDGSHTLEIRATDPSGNVEAVPATYTWTVDTTAPGAPVIEQAPAPVSSKSTFAFARDAGATLECRVDDGAWVPCDTTYAPTLPDGDHALQVRQTDPAGNVSPLASHRWKLDTTAPEAPVVVSGPVASTTIRDTTFEFTAEPGTTIECRLDGAAWTICTSPLNLGSLSLGDHTLELRSTDAAGNVSGTRTERWTIVSPATPTPTPSPAADPVPTPTPAPAPTTVRVDASRSISIDASKATVGCALKGATVDTCEVGVYAMKSDLGLAKKGSPEDKLVRIGTGTATGDGQSSRVGVKITLNSTGQRAMKRVGGVKAKVKIKVTANGGSKLAAHRYTTIRPATQLVVPSDGLFATDSSVISVIGRRYLQSIAIQLRAAKRIECIGHTDAVGAASYNQQLGLSRAKAVCAYLTSLSVKVTKTAASAGESHPRASNMNTRGRALNRRVELNLRYR